MICSKIAITSIEINLVQDIVKNSKLLLEFYTKNKRENGNIILNELLRGILY
jgi:hypothetical protein